MSVMETQEVRDLLMKVSGLGDSGGNPRVKRIVNQLIGDLFRTIEEFDIQPDEFWTAVSYITRLGQANEVALLVPGLGLETFLDIRMDEAERKAGIEGGTPRTIEGPLYVAGAPLSKGEARLDDGTEEGEVLFMHGQVRDVNGKPVAGAVVDVWHANTRGGYSFFDPSQPKYNLRRRIETGADGNYRSGSLCRRCSLQRRSFLRGASQLAGSDCRAKSEHAARNGRRRVSHRHEVGACKEHSWKTEICSLQCR
jgi:catechol 1,2-dioxygenase